MVTQLMRTALRPLYKAAPDVHPGLLLQRGLVEHDDDEPRIKLDHIDRICRSATGDFYRHAYTRWRKATSDTTRFDP